MALDSVRQLLDLVFPSTCPGCGAARGQVICERCLAALAARARGQATWGPGAGGRRECAFAGARSAGLYEGLLRDAVLALKSSLRSFAEPLAYLMVLSSGNDPRYAAPDAVCFVPSARAKVRHRGYNPAELLARAVARRIERPVSGCLALCRATEDQDGLAREERLANVRGAFAAGPGAVEGARVLLVDDVLTTGATADACSRALVAAGAASVHVLVAARAASRVGPE